MHKHTFKTIFKYIASDLYRYCGKKTTYHLVKNYLRNRSFRYSFWLRFCKSNNFAVYMLARFMHERLSKKFFIEIPHNVEIGYGLYIGHHMSIVIHPSTIIGHNCNLSQFITIGSNDGKAAVIGNNVYIGPSVCIVENVVINDNSTIGAGSVVVKNVEENTTVAGCPAKEISKKTPGRFIKNKWEY